MGACRVWEYRLLIVIVPLPKDTGVFFPPDNAQSRAYLLSCKICSDLKRVSSLSAVQLGDGVHILLLLLMKNADIYAINVLLILDHIFLLLR